MKTPNLSKDSAEYKEISGYLKSAKRNWDIKTCSECKRKGTIKENGAWYCEKHNPL